MPDAHATGAEVRVVLKKRRETARPSWVVAGPLLWTIKGDVAYSWDRGGISDSTAHRCEWGLPEWEFVPAGSLGKTASWAVRLVEIADAMFVRTDALGLSPVFCRYLEWGWAIADDVMALVNISPGPQTELRALQEYLFYDGWLGGPLPFSETFRLRADATWRLSLSSKVPILESCRMGSVLRCSHNAGESGGMDALAAALRSGLVGLRGEGPLGLFMSGGLDSTLLAALACEAKVSLAPFTCVVDEHEYDESRAANAVARSLGLDLVEVRLDRRLFLSRLVDAVAASGLPLGFPNQVGLAVIADRAATAGVQVMLTGEGADELFAGYPRLLELRDRLNAPLSADAAAPVRGWDLEREGLLVRSFDDLARLGFGFPDRLVSMMHLRGLLSDIDDPLERELRMAWMTEFITMLPSTLLRLHLACGSAGLRVAFPYLGRRVVQAAVACLPKLALLDHTKPVIRELTAVRLPANVLRLPKSGFDVPLDLWLPPLAEIVGSGFEAAFATSRRSVLAWARYAPASRDLRWAVVNIEIWSRLFILEESVHALKEWVASTPVRSGGRA